MSLRLELVLGIDPKYGGSQVDRIFRCTIPRGNLSSYFMKTIVFSQLHRSKPETLETTYNMKNGFLVMYYIFPPQTTECKNN